MAAATKSAGASTSMRTDFRAPFFQLNIGEAGAVPPAFAALRERIAPRDDMTVKGRLGQMLASAVFHGALLDRRWWCRWVEAATRHAPLVDDLLWIELDPLEPGGDGPASQPRRWFADPITRLLLAHWHRDKLEVDGSDVDAWLGSYLGGKQGEAADALLKHSTVHWQLRIPPLLVAHARGELGTVPICPSNWRRVSNLSFKPSDEPFRRYVPSSGQVGRADTPQRYDAEIARLLTRGSWDIRKRRQSELDAKKQVAEQAGRFAKAQRPRSVLRTLAQWVAFTLTRDRGKLQAGLKPSTVGSYLYYLTAELFDAEDTPIAWTEEQLFERYDTRLGAVELNSRRTKLLDAIYDFHRFLRSEREDLGPTPEHLEDYRAQGRVSANLITPGEYERALGLCDSVEMRLCLMLGFRAGLRLTETLGLTVSDVFEHRGGCELIVTHNKLRRLKTLTSRRIIPLDALLSASELKLLLDWVRERRRAANASRAVGLLIGPVDSDKPLSEGPVAEELHGILHQAAGAALKDHHLRHSFGSYLAATLLLPDEVADPAVPATLIKVISPERKRKLADRLLGSEKLGQHALHATSALMGHIVTPTTLRWYTHLLDLSLMHHVSRPCIEAGLPRAEACALAGQGRARAPLPVGCNSIAEKAGYRRPRLSSAALDGTPPEVWQVSQVRGRRAARIERVLSGPETLEVRAKQRLRSPQPIRQRGSDWREIVGAFHPNSIHPLAEQWRKAAADLQTLTTKSGRPRHPAEILDVPSSRKWIEFLDEHWRHDRSLSAIERRALLYAATHWDTARYGVRFRSRPLALAWRNLLQDLGFANDLLRLSLSGNFADRSSAEIHRMLAQSDDLPGTAARRGWRGTITIAFEGDDEHRRQVRSAGHFLVAILAIREGFNQPQAAQLPLLNSLSRRGRASPPGTRTEDLGSILQLPDQTIVQRRAARWRSRAGNESRCSAQLGCDAGRHP